VGVQGPARLPDEARVDFAEREKADRERRGITATLEALSNKPSVDYGETAGPEIRDINWLIEVTRRIFRPGGAGRVLRINNVTGILQATEAGIGIAAIPDYIAAERHDLVRVLPEIAGPTLDVHLAYADALRQSKRVAAFRDFLVRSSKDWAF